MRPVKSLVLPSRWFLVFAVIVLIVVRVMIIRATSSFENWGDLSIYREVGELVVNGVDPYNTESKRELREQLRLNDYGVPSLKDDKSTYDHYVSANLPASTLLYGLIERLSQGSVRGWRLILIAGDLALLLATYFLLQRSGIALDKLETQLAFSLTTIWYPTLLYWGTVLAEDKQIQTALMLALAAMLTAPGRAPRLNAALIGVVGCLSISFKAFGIFLAPLAVHFFSRRPWRELTIAIFVAVAVALPMVYIFDLAFVFKMLNRFNDSATPLVVPKVFHGSPWSLFPYPWVFYARPIGTIALIGLSISAYVRDRIDLLNCSAAICVVFVCLWMVGGSMDRLNIAMMFALVCTATISVRYWLILSLLNFAVQLPIYIAVAERRHYIPGIDPEMPDAVAASIFILSYFCTILFSKSDARAKFRDVAAEARRQSERDPGIRLRQ